MPISPSLRPPGQREEAGGECLLLRPHCGDVAAPFWEGSQPARAKDSRPCDTGTGGRASGGAALAVAAYPWGHSAG